MRRKSHKLLGEYLAREYMTDIPKSYVCAFLIGCVEPDRNPATYLKGSLKFQWHVDSPRSLKNFSSIGQ